MGNKGYDGQGETIAAAAPAAHDHTHDKGHRRRPLTAAQEGANHTKSYDSLMSPTDARKLALEAQEQLRLQAVRLREEGRSLNEVAQICGVAPTTISEWHTTIVRVGPRRCVSANAVGAKGNSAS